MAVKKTVRRVTTEQHAVYEFELQPDSIRVEVKRGVYHVFNRLLSADERMTIMRESSKQKVENGILYFDGDVDRAFANAWEHMIEAVDGYRLGGEPIDLERARPLIKGGQKRRAIERTETLRVVDDDAMDSGEDLDVDDLTVAMEIRQGDAQIAVAHKFGGPLTAQDLQELRRHRGGLKAQDRWTQRWVGDTGFAKAAREIYDRLIGGVEGYLVRGFPAGEAEEWRKHIPVDHKTLAIGELRNRALGLGRD